MDELIRQGAKRSGILYINKELHEFEPIRDYRNLLSYVKQAAKSQKITALFIDEIQGISQFEKALRDLQAGGRDLGAFVQSVLGRNLHI